jgi:hypothetical protein
MMTKPMGYSVSVNSVRLIVATLLMAWLLPNASQARCDENVTCETLDQCGPFETFCIPLNTMRQCMQRGFPPPERWRRLEGLGANLSGSTGMVTADLESPFFPASPSLPDGIFNNPVLMPSGGGGGQGGGGQDFPEGPATQNPPDCSSYIHPHLVSGCTLRGERKSPAQAVENNCGSALELEGDWTIFTRNASHAVMSIPERHELQFYRRSGANLSYASAHPIPQFYCVLSGPHGTDDDGNPIYHADKVHITPIKQFAEVSAATRYIPLSARHRDGAANPFTNRFIRMSKDSPNRFTPPRPNPEWFVAQNAINVDPNCYSFDHLFSEGITEGFGDIMFGTHHSGMCNMASIRPQSYLANADPGTCQPFMQYYNPMHSTAYIPPLSAASKPSVGVIAGGNPFSRNTLQFKAGFMATKDGQSYFASPYIASSNAAFYLDASLGGINAQQFPEGAVFTISPTRILHVDAPGRIRLGSDYRMQLVDGGVVYDENSNVISRISPNGYVQFPPNQLIEGGVHDNVAPPVGSIIAVRGTDKSLVPYDLRLDSVCE